MEDTDVLEAVPAVLLRSLWKSPAFFPTAVTPSVDEITYL